MSHKQTIELQMPFQAQFLPLATGCVEQAVQAFGMGRGEAMHLALAVEEVYSFLTNRSGAGQRLRLSCRYAGYYDCFFLHLEFPFHFCLSRIVPLSIMIIGGRF